MKITLTFDDGSYLVNLGSAHDISIPICFEGDQLSAFGAPPAKKEVYKNVGFTGAVNQSGSCNCETYTITPHCNGTHTECAGHISENEITIHDILEDALIPATLVSVVPEGDLITRAALAKALARHNSDFMDALVLCTRAKKDETLSPYLSKKAMDYISELRVKHLLVDMPSVDKLDDGGTLANHRIFWNVLPGETDIKPSNKTITELISVPDTVEDGSYLLNLQVAAFKADAAPSRPVLFEVTPL